MTLPALKRLRSLVVRLCLAAAPVLLHGTEAPAQVHAHGAPGGVVLPPQAPSFTGTALLRGAGAAGVTATAAWPGVRLLLRERGWSLVFTEIVRDSALRPRSGDRGPWCGAVSDVARIRSWRVDVDVPAAENAGAGAASGPPAAGVPGGTFRIERPSGSSARIEDIRPGVDLEIVCGAASLRCIWHLRPGCALREIPLLLRGCETDADGAGATARTPLGSLRFPDATAAGGGGTRLLHAGGTAADTLRLLLAADAVAGGAAVAQDVEWSTYFGGSMVEFGSGSAFDAAGNVLIAGWTASADIPATAGVMQTVSGGQVDAFVAKYSPSGALLWMSYLGGDSTDRAMRVTSDAAGNIYVCGHTASADFPVSPGALQTAHAGRLDGFLTALTAGGALRWSTFLGGTQEDECHDVAVDARSGAILLTGRTVSADFPTTLGAFQFMRAGNYDAFVAAFRADGTQAWSSYLGGTAEDWGHAVRADAASNVLVCGHTHSSNFPCTNDAVQASWRGDRDGFVAVFSAAGARKYASYVGGSSWDDVYGIAPDAARGFAVAGATESWDFPVTAGAAQPSYAAAVDAFAMRCDSAGRRIWSTYYGASRKDIATSIAAFPSGNLVCTGSTASADFAVTPGAFQTVPGGGTDAFVLKLRRDGSVAWSTFLGGSGEENLEDSRGLAQVAASPLGEIACTGYTSSADFPVTAGAAQGASAGAWDAFAVKFSCPLDPPVSIAPDGPTAFCEGGAVRLGAPPGYASYRWSTGETTDSILVTSSGSYSVAVTDTNDCGGVSNAIAVTVHPLPTPVILALGPTEFCDGERVDLDAGAGYASYRWSTGDTTRIITLRASATCVVTVRDTNGCEGSSPAVDVTVHPRPVAAVAVTGPTVFCEGGSTLLDAGAGFASYRWSTGDTTRAITVTRTGRYAVIVTNGWGCADTSADVAVTVHALPQPQIAAGGPTTFCDGDSVVLTAGGPPSWSRRWSTGDTTRAIVVRASGSFTVTVRDSNDCSAVSAAVAVTVHPLPAPAVTALGPVVFCDGDSVVLDAGPGYASTRWSTGDSTRTITVRSSGLYRVRAAFATGCAAWSDTLRVTVHPNPAPVIAPDGPLAFCDGDSVTLCAPAGYASYRWSTGAAAPCIVVRVAGAYSVEVTDGNGCRGGSPVVTVAVYPLPAVPAVTQVRDTLLSTPEYRYQWNCDGAPLPGDTARVLRIPRSGSYTVTVFTRDGCSATSPPLAVTIALSSVELPVIEAAPGERVTIPLRLTASEGLRVAGVSGFQTDIRFDGRLLTPLAPATGWSTSGSDRVFGAAGPLADTLGTLVAFECVAMLGPVDSTVLGIDRFEWTSGAVRVTTVNGLFRLRICREGGPRLVDASLRALLAQNQPNPFNATTRIEYQVIERGPVALRVHDAFGRQVAVLREGHCEPGRYSAVFDASALPSGIYLCSLATATRYDQRIMTLIK